MELVKLNPDLGSYFGANEGVLVISAPADSPLNLKGGDVILKIGDRKPTTPSQALRILRSYEPKETVKVEVLRKRQTISLSSTIPERRRSNEFNWHMKAPKAPASSSPPDAPAPPAPPAPAAK
jgi:S1-C subfamily serine protease